MKKQRYLIFAAVALGMIAGCSPAEAALDGIFAGVSDGIATIISTLVTNAAGIMN